MTKEIFSCIVTIYDESSSSDMASLIVECFHQCLITAELVYKRKMEEFFTQVVGQSANGHLLHEQILSVIETFHKLMERSLEENSVQGASSLADFRKTQQGFIQCLEILYGQLPPEHTECSAVAGWLYEFCMNNAVEGKHMENIFKLLFTQRLKYFDGDFFGVVAQQLSKILGQLSEDVVDIDAAAFEMRAVTISTAEAVLMNLCAILKKDLEDVEATVLKVKSMTAKIKYLGDKGAEDDRECFYENFSL